MNQELASEHKKAHEGKLEEVKDVRVSRQGGNREQRERGGEPIVMTGRQRQMLTKEDFYKVKRLGEGSFGVVYLVKCKIDR